MWSNEVWSFLVRNMVCAQTKRHIERLIESMSDLYKDYNYVFFSEDSKNLKYLILKNGVNSKAAGLIAHCPQGDGIPVELYVIERVDIVFQSETIKNTDVLLEVFEQKVIPLL